MTSGNNSGSNPPRSPTQKRPLYDDDTEQLTPSELEQLRQERQRDVELIREARARRLEREAAAKAAQSLKSSAQT